jgi:histidine triad (HIT) family protein
MPDDDTSNCQFCKIVRGDTAAATVYEDEFTLAFLDHRPVFPGHCLVVPKAHVVALPDLPADLLEPLFGAVQRVARGVVDGVPAEGTFVAMNNVVSQSVPHLHVHVVPRRKGDGLKGFFWPRQRYASDAAMAEMQRSIRAAIGR